MIEVTLTREELAMACMIGGLRQANVVANGYVNRLGTGMKGEGPLSNDVNGAGAEVAVAKHFNLHWSGHIVGPKGAPDLGQRIQVRLRVKDEYPLIINPEDREDQAFVHVTGIGPRYKLWGWIWGHEAKQPQHRTHDRWNVKAQFLKPLPVSVARAIHEMEFA